MQIQYLKHTYTVCIHIPYTRKTVMTSHPFDIRNSIKHFGFVYTYWSLRFSESRSRLQVLGIMLVAMCVKD